MTVRFITAGIGAAICIGAAMSFGTIEEPLFGSGSEEAMLTLAIFALGWTIVAQAVRPALITLQQVFNTWASRCIGRD